MCTNFYLEKRHIVAHKKTLTSFTSVD